VTALLLESDPMEFHHTSEDSAYPAQGPRINTVTAFDGRCVRVDVGGELDGVTAEVLNRAVAGVLSTAAPELIELGLAAVTFLDSAGIRCLLTCRAAAENAGSRLVLLDPVPQVARVLEITGLLDLFGLSPKLTPAPDEPAERTWAV
jgi:anti-anti-sigma factor